MLLLFCIILSFYTSSVLYVHAYPQTHPCISYEIFCWYLPHLKKHQSFSDAAARSFSSSQSVHTQRVPRISNWWELHHIQRHVDLDFWIILNDDKSNHHFGDKQDLHLPDLQQCSCHDLYGVHILGSPSLRHFGCH